MARSQRKPDDDDVATSIKPLLVHDYPYVLSFRSSILYSTLATIGSHLLPPITFTINSPFNMKFSAVAVAAFAGLSYAEMQANAATSEQAELEYGNPLAFLGNLGSSLTSLGSSLGINLKNLKCAGTCVKKALDNTKCEEGDTLRTCGCKNLDSVANEAAACATAPSCGFPSKLKDKGQLLLNLVKKECPSGGYGGSNGGGYGGGNGGGNGGRNGGGNGGRNGGGNGGRGYGGGNNGGNNGGNDGGDNGGGYPGQS
ncbi:hypothetical protein L249_6385 [Ophiocordyceps polyrhachis-furcata BCC 54312]|uniref:Uncharacterized protein n=1 Tax=Ophiocordyceps polyrhachis-furcata BCC 54312 TaxID=1330021 RepID=A0A367LM39_9HYPO|nr:hypothetical protein L249_6385 [Ophiocordyceps polyrhachis-furcata BCC 54312]